MRHGASMVAAMEGISRPVYRISKELAQNSRSGLTVRFLSKKLEVPEEEIEYLVDVNHKLLFTDLTKIKLAAEGLNAVKRIGEGLENLGDVPSLYRRIKALSAHDFRTLEEQLGLQGPCAKKIVAEQVVEQFYKHPDSIVEHVASHGFSPIAREIFDIVWQSRDGVMPVSKIRAAHGASEYDIEQGIWELFRGLALFEMFRFDAEERLIRVGGLLSEIRQWREGTAKKRQKKSALKSVRKDAGNPRSRSLELTDSICQLVAAIAAKPARVRGDGELFREDLRRLSEIVPEDAEPSLSTCLWAAEGVEWLSRVDDELRAGELEALIDVDRLDRHRVVFEWMTSNGNEPMSRRVLTDLMDEMKSKALYGVLDFVETAVKKNDDADRAVLKPTGGHFRYVSPTAAANLDKTLARSLEETLNWLGVVEKDGYDEDAVFRVTEIGRCLLTDTGTDALKGQFAQRSREIVIQPNFDIVVPTQDMDPLLTVPLDQFAERQSTGQATVYHLSKGSFTQGLQDGHDGDAFVEFLLLHNRGGSLPANVMTTLDDWRGGLRRVRVRTIHVIEADAPLVMADLQHRRKFRKFLAQIDAQKTIAYQAIGKADLVKQLEKDGFIVD